MNFAGLAEEKPHKTALNDACASLEMLVKQQKNASPSPLPIITKSVDGLVEPQTFAHGPT